MRRRTLAGAPLVRITDPIHPHPVSGFDDPNRARIPRACRRRLHLQRELEPASLLPLLEPLDLHPQRLHLYAPCLRFHLECAPCLRLGVAGARRRSPTPARPGAAGARSSPSPRVAARCGHRSGGRRLRIVVGRVPDMGKGSRPPPRPPPEGDGHTLRAASPGGASRPRLVSPRTAPLAVRVRDVAQLAAVDPGLCRCLADLLDERASRHVRPYIACTAAMSPVLSPLRWPISTPAFLGTIVGWVRSKANAQLG